MTPKKCFKCGSWVKHASNFTRHIKHCGEKKVPCPDCEKVFSRKDALKRHSQKAHPQRLTTQEFTCQECHKGFTYETSLRLHEKLCGKSKVQPFCRFHPGYGLALMHTNHFRYIREQDGCGGARRKRQQKPKLFKTVKQVYKPDKEVSTLKGLKVDVSFYPKTETQRIDQQIFFKETLSRLKLYLEKVLKEKKGVKWNLLYHCVISIPDKYRDVPLKHSHYISSHTRMTTTYPEQLLNQLNSTMEMVEERMTTYKAGWVLDENCALVLELTMYAPIG